MEEKKGQAPLIRSRLLCYAGGVTREYIGAPLYLIKDYVQAVVNPAKAMTIIDLLTGQAEKAKGVFDTSPPQMSKQQYLDLQDGRLIEELYTGK